MTHDMRHRMHEMVRTTQDTICAALEKLDGSRFREDNWERPEGGGGRTRVLRGGGFFEKAGVNVSAVHGPMPPGIVAAARGRGAVIDGDDPQFYATGVSLVLHPANPMAPTAHANYRYFEIDSDGAPSTWWFGGGTDLTPCYLFEEDAVHFHQVLKDACDPHDEAFYPRMKKECDEYFHLPHRNEARGVGGIFFDNLNDRDPEDIFAFSRSCQEAIVPAVLPIYERRKDMPFTEAQKEWQQIRRGRYVEFNLVYDRGTTFGLRTGGRIESILMSLPAHARWEYDHHPEPGTEEARLVEVLENPREWV